jgi:hypothetical protein
MAGYLRKGGGGVGWGGVCGVGVGVGGRGRGREGVGWGVPTVHAGPGRQQRLGPQHLRATTTWPSTAGSQAAVSLRRWGMRARTLRRAARSSWV